MKEIIYTRGNNFQPDFFNLAKVLENKIPSRPTLFEFAINDKLAGKLSGIENIDINDRIAPFARLITAFQNAGYDYTTISGWRTNTLNFPKSDTSRLESISLNARNMITDRNSFELYPWPVPEIGDYEIYYDLKKYLPDGMKLIASGNGGLLENVIDITGFDNLCIMCLTDEELIKNIFDEVGKRLLRFYEIVASVETVGACIVNDDWGFKNQTMLSPEMLRKWVFPWHKKMVEAIHNANKYAILHSCGNLKSVMDDVIIDMGYNAKHSFEDLITPIEDAIDLWGDKIVLLGGVDMDFLARGNVAEISKRSQSLIEKGMNCGGYALGSGNSIPEYIPNENFIAMISTVKLF